MGRLQRITSESPIRRRVSVHVRSANSRQISLGWVVGRLGDLGSVQQRLNIRVVERRPPRTRRIACRLGLIGFGVYQDIPGKIPDGNDLIVPVVQLEGLPN